MQKIHFPQNHCIIVNYTPTMLLYRAKKIFIICLLLFIFMLQQVLKELLQMDWFSFEKKLDVSKVMLNCTKRVFLMPGWHISNWILLKNNIKISKWKKNRYRWRNLSMYNCSRGTNSNYILLNQICKNVGKIDRYIYK